jgi:hypothetical protein
VFAEDLHALLPKRALPLSTTPPTDLATLFDNEVKEIQKLLSPGSRRRTEAEARLRALAIVESSISGEKVQPGVTELKRLADQISARKKSWDAIFPAVATLTVTAQGHGPSIDLRIAKTGAPVQLVAEGTPGAAVVAVKRVDELGFYNLGRDQLAKTVGLSGPKTTAVIRFLRLQSDSECYKEVCIGKSRFGRYSQKAIARIKKAVEEHKIERIWAEHGVGRTVHSPPGQKDDLNAK